MHRKAAFYIPNFVLNFHGVRFRNFWNNWYFRFQHFGLKLPISGLILTILDEKLAKMWKLNILTHKVASLVQNTSNKHRAVTIHPPARLVGEPKKTKRMEGRKTSKTVANWLFAQTTHVVGSKSNFAWWVACGVVVIHVKCDPNRLRGYGAVMGRKWPFPITVASGL